MRKKQLIEELNRSQERVRQLEDLICPAESHEWDTYATFSRFDGYMDLFETTFHQICRKCRKRKTTVNFT